ncbi:LysM peptidoglycan-binding domain-containing protein [Erythrobacter sp. EC-HK427]|uniref:LysM peptidoglycan-binding domain-containing protein n=1 Tax=Erythrobacter sp. EC-HK427 TaxID=2038396 RepID=UPI001251F6EA|nr:LysM peptidoglycan-binding domain-containing protein [Erythrobacter sp. EC-HK427]VVT11341.1 conserved hypothetical protein [Erythrobacter sp. EC-HK427]
MLAVSPLALAALPNGAAAECDSGYVTYRMQEGDTLYGLSERYFRGVTAVGQIARLNGIRNPRRIPVGTELRIPRRYLTYRDAGLQVRHSSGTVQINGVQANRAMQVPDGGRIETSAGSFLTLQSADGSTTITLPANARAQLACSRIYALGDLRDIQFDLLDGRGEIRAPVLRTDERFRTSTPVAVTAVRGTEYRVSYDDTTGIGTAEVTEGRVAVAADESFASEVLPEAGFGVAASQAGVGEVEQLLPPPEVGEIASVQMAETVDFTVAPPAGGAASRVQIARDETFVEVIAEDLSSDGSFSFAGLEDGRYLVRVRGVAENGLEGLSEEFRFRRKRLGAEGSVEQSTLADGFRFVWSAQGTGLTHFAFQLWREGEPGVLLYDEIALPGDATLVTALEPGVYVWRIGAMQTDAEEGLLTVWSEPTRLPVDTE